MWSRRLPSLSRNRKSESPPRPHAAHLGSTDCTESSTRLSEADAVTVPPVKDEALTNPLGLSVLYDPGAAQAPIVDIILVHGLGGTSIRTWCQNGDRSLCWPKNWLPREPGFEQVRVLTFGYDAGILSRTKTVSSISDFAKTLLSEMKHGKNNSMEDLNIGNVSHSLLGVCGF